MVKFFRAEERRSQREEERAEREAQQWEEERRFAAEQEQLWIAALQNAWPPPLIAAPPGLSVQKFNEETDDMAAYLDTFEAVATASEWPRAQWSIHLRGSLSGARLLAISTLNVVQQANFQILKNTLLASLSDLNRDSQKKGV